MARGDLDAAIGYLLAGLVSNDRGLRIKVRQALEALGVHETPHGWRRDNPLLAVVGSNPPGTLMATAVYSIAYQHAGERHAKHGREHVFEQPERVKLYVTRPDTVVMQGAW